VAFLSACLQGGAADADSQTRSPSCSLASLNPPPLHVGSGRLLSAVCFRIGARRRCVLTTASAVDLRDYFSRFGSVQEVFVRDDRPQAFVKFGACKPQLARLRRGRAHKPACRAPCRAQLEHSAALARVCSLTGARRRLWRGRAQGACGQRARHPRPDRLRRPRPSHACVRPAGRSRSVDAFSFSSACARCADGSDTIATKRATGGASRGGRFGYRPRRELHTAALPRAVALPALPARPLPMLPMLPMRSALALLRAARVLL
jgi:hypothetical protein